MFTGDTYTVVIAAEFPNSTYLVPVAAHPNFIYVEHYIQFFIKKYKPSIVYAWSRDGVDKYIRLISPTKIRV